MRKHLSLLVLACLAGAGVANAVPDSFSQGYDIIKEAKGTPKLYYKKAAGYYPANYQRNYFEIDNAAAKIYFADNNEVYFYNIVTYGFFDSYVKGTLDGNRITVDFPQTVYDEVNWGYSYNLCIMKYTEDDPYATDGWTYTPTDLESVTFLINDDGSITLELPGDEYVSGTKGEYCLGYMYTDTLGSTGYLDFFQEYTPIEQELAYIPENLETTEYSFIVDNGGYFVNVAKDDNYVYVQGLSNITPQFTIKAKLENGMASVPMNQISGILGINFMYTKCLEFDEAQEKFILAPDADYVFEVTDNSITAVDPDIYFCFNGSTDAILTNGIYIYDNIVLDKKNVTGPMTPQNPYGLAWDESTIAQLHFPSFQFFVSNVSTDGRLMLNENLYYKIYMNGSLFTFKPNASLYHYPDLEEATTEVPYDFNNNYDIAAFSITEREVGLRPEGIETVGVSLLYKDGDTVTESEIVTLNIETGEITPNPDAALGEINADYEVVGTEYLTVGGLKVSHPEKGIYIKRDKLSDGSVKVSKIRIL